MWIQTFWALTGSIASSGAQWVVVLLIARSLGYRASGDYALALAIVNPVMVLANLQLRGIQSSDAAGHFRFSDYLALRLSTTAAASTLVIALGVTTGAVGWILPATLGLKAMDSITDIYQGAFHRGGRVEWAAQSQIVRAAVVVTGVAMGCWIGRSAAVAIGIAAAASAIAWACFDRTRTNLLEQIRQRPSWPTLLRLAASALPLGITMMLVSLQQSIPRFALERFAGREEVGHYAAISAIPLCLNLAMNAIGQGMTNQLARLAHEGRLGEFRQLLVHGMLAGAALVATAAALCLVAGRGILRVVYGDALAGEELLLTLQTIAAGIAGIAGLCGYALTALRRFRAQLVIFVPLTLVTATASWLIVPRFGVLGASGVLVGTAIVQLSLAGIVLAAEMSGRSATSSGAMAEA